jgi:MFS family permease
LARSVPGRRQGLAFGVKQSAVPTSIVLGGLAVPTIGVVLGWRWTYAATAVASAVVVALALRAAPGQATRRSGAKAGETPPTGPLLLTGAATAMANASANALGAFLPAWAFQTGFSPGAAGALAAAGALLCVVGRVQSGLRADRRVGRHFPVVAGQLVLGAGGLALLSSGSTVPLVAGALLAFAFGWSWPGLLMFAVVRVGRDRPATASGAVQAGGFAGGAAGPVLFGLLVTSTSWSVAWTAAAGVMVVAAALLLQARRLFLADIARRPLP